MIRSKFGNIFPILNQGRKSIGGNLDKNFSDLWSVFFIEFLCNGKSTTFSQTCLPCDFLRIHNKQEILKNKSKILEIGFLTVRKEESHGAILVGGGQCMVGVV